MEREIIRDVGYRHVGFEQQAVRVPYLDRDDVFVQRQSGKLADYAVHIVRMIRKNLRHRTTGQPVAVMLVDVADNRLSGEPARILLRQPDVFGCVDYEFSQAGVEPKPCEAGVVALEPV